MALTGNTNPAIPAPRWVMIIEDDKSFADLIEESLKKCEYRTVRASALGDAIAKLRRQKFNCILLDLSLEKKAHGRDVLDLIRKDAMEANHKTPVIIMSGLLTKEVVMDLVATEAVKVLAKPFTSEKLVESVRSVCGDST